MNALLRRRLEMAGRVRDFLRAHKTDAVGEGLGLAKLEELIARAEALDAQQRAGVVVTRSSTKQRRELRHALQSKLLLYLRALGALVETENGELAVQFQFPPANGSQQALLTAGRGMLEKATAQKDVLLGRGMPPTLLRGRARHHQPRPLLRVERLRSRDQLLELREPEPFTNSVRLVGPQKITNPRGHLQPPT